MEDTEILLEKLENNNTELIKTLYSAFEEQSKENVDFFNKILELIKSEIRLEDKSRNEKLDKIITKLEHSTELNKKITDELIYRIETIETLNEDEKESSILYKDIKKGIKQFAIQTGITTGIILMVCGAYHLIKFIF